MQVWEPPPAPRRARIWPVALLVTAAALLSYIGGWIAAAAWMGAP